MSKTQGFLPQWVSTPGETITDILRERDLSVADFAREIGEPMEEVEALLTGRSTITIAVARRLQSLLGASVEFWMTRDFQYREDIARREATEVRRWLSEIPVGDMIRFGWLHPPPHPSEEVLSCLQFFGVPDIHTWRKENAAVSETIAYRTSRSLDSRSGAVAAWLRRGIIESMALQCTDWNPNEFRDTLPKIRRLTRLKDPRQFVPELQRQCAACGVAVAVVRPPTGCRASGATFFFAEDRALLLLSSRYLSDDQFWFTFFHEAGHLLLHADRQLILEGLGTSSDVEEEQANLFAERVIIPAEFEAAFQRLRADAFGTMKFARAIGISPGLLVGQLQHKGIIRPNQLNRLKRRYEWSQQGLVIREKD